MTGVMVVQGRKLSAGDIAQMQGRLAELLEWGRTRRSEELCRRWDWNGPATSCCLPGNGVPPTDSATEPIHGILPDLPPLSLSTSRRLRLTGASSTACRLATTPGLTTSPTDGG